MCHGSTCMVAYMAHMQGACHMQQHLPHIYLYMLKGVDACNLGKILTIRMAGVPHSTYLLMQLQSRHLSHCRMTLTQGLERGGGIPRLPRTSAGGAWGRCEAHGHQCRLPRAGRARAASRRARRTPRPPSPCRRAPPPPAPSNVFIDISCDCYSALLLRHIMF